jgi:serine/threonine protein kinase
MEDLTSRKLGPYRLTRLLAHGGMSEVYLASDERDDQQYALKLVRQSQEEYCHRFQHEAQTLMQLHHPHILPLFDYGIEEEICYYVMPYLAEGTLKDRLARGALPEQEAAEVLGQVAEALHFLHQAGFVHRDVKSSNILLGEANHAWLADFGLVREREGGRDFTRTGYLIGTPSYMAPELAQVSASVQSDLYSLGVVLYEMLTGQIPFPDGTPFDRSGKSVLKHRPEPSTGKPDISPAVEAVVLRALARKPADRYASVEAMAEAYQNALRAETAASSFQLQEGRSLASSSVKAIPRQKPRMSLAIGALATLALLTLGLVSLGGSAHASLVVQASVAQEGTGAPTPPPLPTPTPPKKKTGSQAPAVELQRSSDPPEKKGPQHAPTIPQRGPGLFPHQKSPRKMPQPQKRGGIPMLRSFSHFATRLTLSPRQQSLGSFFHG